MVTGQIKWEVVVLTVLCVALIFFFPATRGPYSAVHGPVTALQSAHAAAHLRIAIVQAALSSFRNHGIRLLLSVSCMAVLYAEFHSASLADFQTILRC
jgi:hypothetical protein